MHENVNMAANIRNPVFSWDTRKAWKQMFLTEPTSVEGWHIYVQEHFKLYSINFVLCYHCVTLQLVTDKWQKNGSLDL